MNTFEAAFAVLWVGSGFAALTALARIKDPQRKRTSFIWVTVTGGVIFAAFLIISSLGDPRSLVFIPVIGLIVLLNIQLTKFCPRCAAWNYNWTWVLPMRYCRRCGADLQTGNRPSQA